MESRIEGAAPRQDTHGVTAVSSTSTARVRDRYWRAFCAWCDRCDAANLPARAETVAEYLWEVSETGTHHANCQRRYAIRKKHLEVGYDDPCATPLVQSTMREIRQAGAGYSPKSLNPAALEAIRLTAATPRLTGRGWEPVAAALKRGPVDIALCSVIHAARLTVVQAVALKWRDVETPGEGEATLTVKSGTDGHASAEFREIAGQAVRDLEAIRGDARPEDSVFGLTVPKAYRHIKTVARHAGLVAGGEPSTAGPCQTAPADPCQTTPTNPGQTASPDPGQWAPAVPGQTTPTNPGQWAPAVPWQSAPAVPWQTPPAEPWQPDPTVPWQWVPAVPGQSAPVVPWQTAPEVPWQTAPTVPWQTASPDPWPSTPADPWQTASAVPWQSVPAVAGQSVPADPWQMAPADPWQMAPADPWQMAPADPWQMAPADPWQMAPADPWQMAPADLWQSAPTDPWQTDPAVPWQTDPAVPWQWVPAVPGQTCMEGWQPSSQ